MDEEHKSEHLFLVQQHCGHAAYISADQYIFDRDKGTVHFMSKPDGAAYSEEVATLFLIPGMTIARVDCLFTTEGVKET